MQKLGFGIIGTGSIVQTYIKCLEEMEGVTFVGLLSTSPERARAVQEEMSVPVFSDLDTFLSLPELDVVCICNQSGRHGAATIAAAKKGKHVLCEKPLEVTLDKVDKAIEACNANNVKLGCVFQNRCTDAFQTVYDTVRQGKLGKLLMGNAYINWYRTPEYYAQKPWRGTMDLDGGATLMNQGIHTLDLLLHVFGDVESVHGNIRTLVHPIEGEDVGNGIVAFKNGALGTVTGGTALYPGYPERLEIYGELGSIRMEGGAIMDWNIKDAPVPEGLVLNKESGSGASDPGSIGNANHKKVLEDMVRAIHEDRPPMVPGLEARKSVELICALYESSRTGKTIMF